MVTPVQPFTSEPLPDLAAAVESAGRAMGAGVVYPVSARQDEARQILESPQGAGLDGQNVLSGDGSLGFPVDMTPPDAFWNGGYGGA
jgi:hypothetical protein